MKQPNNEQLAAFIQDAKACLAILNKAVKADRPLQDLADNELQAVVWHLETLASLLRNEVDQRNEPIDLASVKPLIHKASSMGGVRCDTCAQRVHRVPGGQGPTWVHTESGAVAGVGPPWWPGVPSESQDSNAE